MKKVMNCYSFFNTDIMLLFNSSSLWINSDRKIIYMKVYFILLLGSKEEELFIVEVRGEAINISPSKTIKQMESDPLYSDDDTEPNHGFSNDDILSLEDTYLCMYNRLPRLKRKVMKNKKRPSQ